MAHSSREYMREYMRKRRRTHLRVEYQVKVNEAVFEGEPTKDVTVLSTMFCCEQMEKSWGEETVRLDDDEMINIALASDYMDYEGYQASRHPIKFCPWCGKRVKAIKLRVAKTVFDPASPERVPITFQGKPYMLLNYKRATIEVVEELAKPL